MKKIAFSILISMSLIAAGAFIFSPKLAIGSKKPVMASPGVALPDSIQKMVQKACMDCHADDGSSMARGKLNFSKWDSYDVDKQIKKANAMSKEITKNSMPPKKWRTNNPNDVPTQAEIELVSKWAKSLQK
jgi:uncharacterized membrane protein